MILEAVYVWNMKDIIGLCFIGLLIIVGLGFYAYLKVLLFLERRRRKVAELIIKIDLYRKQVINGEVCIINGQCTCNCADRCSLYTGVKRGSMKRCTADELIDDGIPVRLLPVTYKDQAELKFKNKSK